MRGVSPSALDSAAFVLKPERTRPARVPEQLLAQLDHGLLFAIGAIDFPTMDPRGEPGRLSPIDPLGQPRQVHDPVDEEFLDRIARLPTELPGIGLFLVFAEILGRQDQDIRPAAVVEGIEPRPILSFFSARAGSSVASSGDSLRSAPRWPWRSAPI